MDWSAAGNIFLATTTLALAVATWLQARSAKTHKLTEHQTLALARSESARANQAGRQLAALEGERIAADKTARALDRQASTQKQALVQARLEEDNRRFRNAAKSALNTDPNVAVPGILMLSNIINANSSGSQDAEIVRSFALLRSGVSTFLTGILLARVREVNASGDGYVKADLAVKAAAEILAQKAGIDEGLKVDLKAIAAAPEDGDRRISRDALLGDFNGTTAKLEQKLALEKELGL